MATSTMKRIAALAIAVTAAATGTLGGANMAQAAQPYDIIVQSGAGGSNSLKGRTFIAYKLSDYVDGTFVSVGNKQLDGVSLSTPESLKNNLNRVLAKTAGVADAAKLPGWEDAGKDPIAWMGGFRQQTGSNQASGSFGYGWNDSGMQGIGNNSPSKAYVGSVREFADNLVKDQAALESVKAQPKSRSITCATGKQCTIPLTESEGSGIYLILDSGSRTTWQGTDANGWVNTWNVGVTQPMIVPTKADQKDLATVEGHAPGNPNSLGTVGELGTIVVKNVVDEEVLPNCPPDEPDEPGDCVPKRRDESTHPGKDAADNASDVGDAVPYQVRYRVPDLSAYRNAFDNGRQWIYHYRVIDQTTAGLSIDKAPTVKLNGQVIELTRVDTLPEWSGKGTGTAQGQPNEPDAWYYLSVNDKDESKLVIGLGRWIVKHYGDLALNDKSKTLYGHEFDIRYSAMVTPKILEHRNMAHNENWVEYSNNPADVNGGDHVATPHVTVKQWTYDLDLRKRSSTSNSGLSGAQFSVTVKSNGNASDGKANGSKPMFVSASSAAGDYRLAHHGEQGSNTVTTGKDGLLRLRGLDLGSYTLTETKAAHGHQLLKHSEDYTIDAQFHDDRSDFITPNVQTEASLSITQRNIIVPLAKPMLNFASNDAIAGLTVSKTKAVWSGKSQSGAWHADDKTAWLETQLTLWNQPINVMLAQTGGIIGFGVTLLFGGALITAGVLLLAKRRMMEQTTS